MSSNMQVGEHQDPRSPQIQTHWLNPALPNTTVAPLVKIDYDFRDIHADFDVHLDDTITNPEREKALVFDVRGVVVSIKPEYIILFVPIPKFWKVFIPKRLLKKSPFVTAGHVVRLGEWMQVSAVKRTPPRDGLPDDKPKYSHICYDSRDLKFFDAALNLSQWEHRFVNGVFQVKMVIALINPGSFNKVHDENGTVYWIADSGVLQALIPRHRLTSIRAGNWRDSVLIFWVNRGRVIADYCVHLFETEHIEQHFLDGTVSLHISPFQCPEEFALAQTIAGPEVERILPVDTEESLVNTENNVVDSPSSYRSPSPEEIPMEFLTMAQEEQEDISREEQDAFEKEVINEFAFLNKIISMENRPSFGAGIEREQLETVRPKAQSSDCQPASKNSRSGHEDFLQSYLDPETQALFPHNYPRRTVASVLFDILEPHNAKIIVAEGFRKELLQIAEFVREYYCSTSNNNPTNTDDNADSSVFVPHE